MNTATPLGYLDSAGTRADAILPLTWYMLIVSILVCVIIGWILVRALRRSRANGGDEETRAVAVEEGPSGTHWIRNGLLISSVPLLVALVWTMVTLAAVSGPPARPALTLDVVGHQWWWEVTYDGTPAAHTFTTANEIHIPVGQRVLVRLHGADVIHSFWVPKLSGKTDTIPGQTNLSWLEARVPGVYTGPCSEYCGEQHAHMMVQVVAQSSAQFDQWFAQQLQPATAPTDSASERGAALFEYRCGACHQIRGTQAGAHAGPDLSHIAGRRTLAAGLLPNTPGTLAAWIENAHGLKPGNQMPNQNLTGGELMDVIAYLELQR
ncbi:MAG TPA: cytochrome c oxidase subunit II [Steroidobacteraceae bacterium]|jgi:cytochrome c oxidase subunit 2|nr:cytochrome c oxidase subunit II [Steroidobacteraceae bacterium]